MIDMFLRRLRQSGMSFREIGDMLEISPKAARRRYKYSTDKDESQCRGCNPAFTFPERALPTNPEDFRPMPPKKFQKLD